MYDCIDYIETQDTVDPLHHSSFLESAAKEYFSMEDPEDHLAERVEKYINWDGELNEIVHYTRKGVTGRDVLINIMLSDEDGDTNNKDIIFGWNFKHFGVKIGTDGKDGYCVVMDYASHLGNEKFQDPVTPSKFIFLINLCRSQKPLSFGATRWRI